MKLTKKQLKEISKVEKKVSEVCDNNDSTVDEMTGITYPKESEIHESIIPKEILYGQKKMHTPNKNDTTLREFLAFIFADIDIFLLKDKSQEYDKDKLFTTEEIRNQLQSTMKKMTNLPFIHPSIYDVDLFSALSHKVLTNSGFSEKYINSLKK